ncbi:MAG TPA: DUF4129 domain-containing protein [Thermoanaerobaculia bacterium]|nr:DUF4129 domain-containing protein [Thermoanaerobaculia bacterium]
MDLERVAAVIRPRSPWEAVDLGFGMVRAWWKPVWAAWLTTVAPAWWLVWCLTWLASGSPFVAFVAVWWLRPLFDRVPLYVVSRRLFGSSPSLREVRRDLPRLWTRQLWAALTLQRLDPARSFDLPVWELEGLRGQDRKARTTLLQRVSRQNALWLTFACWLLEGFTILALIELVSLLTPSSGWNQGAGMAGLAADSGEPGAAFWWWISAVDFLALTAIEPFYVAAGFSLYLSRRIHLEGWDVELAFRRLAARLTGEPLRRKAGRAAAMVLLIVLAFHPSPARGRGAGGEGSGVRTPANAAREVLEAPEFQTHKKMKIWRPKGDWNLPQGREGSSLNVSLSFLRPLILVVAAALLVGLLAVAVGGVIRRRRSQAGEDEPAGRGPLPAAVFGLDIRPESLPDDVPGAAWSAWERGDPAAALGLLYRAAIAFLVHREGLPVRASWTEGDCVDFVRRKIGPERIRSADLAEYFARLTRAWQSAAYAHRPPSTEEARALCTAWGRHFREAEAA